MATRDTKIVRDVSTSVPIELLNSDAVRLYTHAYPFLVLALFYARFNTTVADPVSSLSQLVLPICILQAIYMIICLPAATSMPPSLPSQPPSTTKPSAQQQQQQQQQQRKKPASTKPSFSLTYFNTKILPALLSTLLALFVATPLLTTLVILHGAPITTYLPQTLLTGVHLSILATAPLFYAHGVSSAKWRDIVSLCLPVDEVSGAAIGTLMGAWIGAVPIPLDWDREWQKWPVTIVAGAYMGWAIGKLAGGTVFKGRRIQFD